MNRYRIEAIFRPNANKPDKVTRQVWVDAPNREAALLLAGNRLGLEGTGIIAASLIASITRVGKNGWSS